MAERANERTLTTRFYEDLWQGGRGWILVFVSMGWFLVIGGRIVYPALLPLVAQEFPVGYATIGGLVGGLWAAYAVMQFPGGLLADRFGERVVLVSSLSLSLIGMAALTLSPVFLVFVIATVVLGVSNGLFGTTRITVLSDIFKQAETTAISVSQAAGNVGNSVLPIIAGVVAAALGWRFGFGFMLPLFALAAAGTWAALPERTSVAADKEPLIATTRDVLVAIRARPVLKIATLHFLAMLLYQSLTGFLPTYLIEVKSLPADTAATLYGGFFISATLVQFVSGVVADRYGKRLTMSGFLLLSVPGYVLLPYVDGLLALAGVAVLLSLMLGAYPPIHAYAVQVLPTNVQGSGYGLIRSVNIALGAAGPPIIGRLADIGLFDESFFLLGAVALVASVNAALLSVPE